MNVLFQCRSRALAASISFLVIVLPLRVAFSAPPNSSKGDKQNSATGAPTGKPDQKSEAKTAKLKIVLIGAKIDNHPYASHMYLQECRLLATCLNQTPKVETVVVQDWPDAKTLAGARALVFYSRPAGDVVLDPKNKAAFQKLMADGVGYTAIHWATGAEKKFGNEYLDVLGAWFHPSHCSQAIETQNLDRIDSKHEICRGWDSYKLRDEFYSNLKFHARAKPLLRVTLTSPKIAFKQQVVAWTFERPDGSGGRSFGTTLGHFHENFGITAFRKLLVNGILWTAHVEVPADGAAVAVNSRDLELPPPISAGTAKKK